MRIPRAIPQVKTKKIDGKRYRGITKAMLPRQYTQPAFGHGASLYFQNMPLMWRQCGKKIKAAWSEIRA
jgi:hypothetical protein